MIDLEVNQAIYQLAQGVEVDDDTTCVDLINELGFCTRGTYLETEHTLRHFRQVGWNPDLFDRTYCDHTASAAAGDAGILEKAEQAWRQLVASQEPIDVPPDFARELDRIVEAAKKELLS